MRQIAPVVLIVVASFVAGCKTKQAEPRELRTEHLATPRVTQTVDVEPVTVSGTGETAGSSSNVSSSGTAAPVVAVAPTETASRPFVGITEAVAVVHATTEGGTVHGIVRFSQVDGGVRIVADLDGLAPKTTHGFHIHEFGDCSGDVKTVGGGHYNPENTSHGGPDAEHHHAGDFGNVETDDQGHAHLDRVMAGLTIAGERNPILGRSVIVHANADDMTTQPSGNAGERIGCGVIGLAKPAAK